MGALLRVQVRHELVTVSEVKRICMRATDCGRKRGLNMQADNENRIKGVAGQGERPATAKLL